MTSIFSGNLYRSFVTDQNQLRLANFDVNRFQKTIEQSAAQGRLEKELREGLEFHQAIMADLQTKLNEVVEKLNNIYRRHMDNNVAFNKPKNKYQTNVNSDAVAFLPRVDDPNYPDTAGYPAGTANILPHDDFDKIRNFSYNPYFGSKAIEESDQTTIRTFWERQGTVSEDTYRENGAFWSSLSYLWGWDLDRINATYVTSNGLPTDPEDGVQINITALQPNKPQYPPLQVGDRFPLNWTGNGGAVADYPAVNVSGLRPGGADYNHATDSIDTDSDSISGDAAANVAGHDSVNFGWEFDDLPMALEVVEVDTRPDGTTVPTEYKVVYDIPPTHPHYEELRVLNGTEPMINDAPTQFQKDRIANDGFDYSGYTFIPGSQSGEVYYAFDGVHQTGNTPWATNTAENEYPPPKLYTAATIVGADRVAYGGQGTAGSPVLMDVADIAAGLFGQSSPIELSSNGGTTYPVSTTVSAADDAVRYNQAVTRTDTNNGDMGIGPIRVNLPANNFDAGDYVTFDTRPGEVYEVDSPANSDGFSVIPATPPGTAPMPPISAGDDGVVVRVWQDVTASTPKYPSIPNNRVGLVLNSPVSPTAVNRVKTPNQAGATEPIATFVLRACSDLSITPATNVSMKYKFTVHQNFKQFASPGDDGELPQPPYQNWSSYEWTSNPPTPIMEGQVVQNDFGYPLAGVPDAYIANAAMGAGLVELGRASQHPGPASVAGDNAGWFSGDEVVSADIVAGANPNEAIIRVFFEGDLNGFEMEIEDVQLVTYDGNLNNWDQGLYNAGNFAPNPDIQVGDLPISQGDDPDDVVNKYIPGLYQFTQFNDQYNNSYNAGDANDIVRSPWEFAELHFGDNSGISGEMWLDINGRRLNLDNDDLQDTTTGWGTVGAASTNSNTVYDVSTASSDPFFDLLGGSVNNAHAFQAAVHPGDDCIASDPEGNNESYQFSDSDPLSATNRNETVDDEVNSGEAPITSATVNPDPARTGNPAGQDVANYYQANNAPAPTFAPVNPGGGGNYLSGLASNDTTGTVDRIGASISSSNATGLGSNLGYTVSIPTTDVNVLKNENNLLFNFGSIEQRDWGVNVSSLDMFMRTIPSYTSVPRYRVDSGGNIYDRFGDGYYDLSESSPGVFNNPDDKAAADEIYTLSNGATNNGQVSNADGVYNNNPGAYNTGGSFEDMINENDRFSMDDDDFNLFDYTPNLNLVPGNPEDARKSETYVGSLPSNFYYYREELDNSQAEGGGNVPTGDNGVNNFNNDKKPAINFDGRNSNLSGAYNAPHTSIYNTNLPSFTNVTLGIVEQNAKEFNTTKKTSYAVWQDFPGLNAPVSFARSFNPAQTSANVVDAVSAVGNSTDFAEMGFPTSFITLDMGSPVNNAGYLIINEEGSSGVEPHAIPLPLLDRTAPYPAYSGDTPESYTFNSYGSGTVTRTGSKFMSFEDVVDAADGIGGNGFAGGSVAQNQAILESHGGEFAIGDPLGTADNWPNGVLLHVDDATKFEMEYPKNIVTLGDDATRYRIMYRNSTSDPQSLFLVRDNGANLTNTLPGATTNTRGLVHADLQIRELTGTYTVSVVDETGTPDVDGENIRIDYDHNGTEREGKLVSVGLSSVVDRVGRLPGDDPRTAAVENNRIGPEVFDDPKGYVQPDAQVDLSLVSQDKDGNLKARKLTKVKVEVKSGEQIIPANLQQVYSTFDESLTGIGGAPATGQPFDLNGGAAGNWPIAIYDGDVQINPEVTNDLNYFVGYYQGIVEPLSDTDITVVDGSDFREGQEVSVNGEQRVIQSIAGNVITLNEPLIEAPKLGDRLNMGRGTGKQDLQLFLNRNFAMSVGAGLKVTLEYEEYQYVGYPPTIDKTSPEIVTEEIGFADDTPKSELAISPTNGGTGLAGDGIEVTGNLADYNVGDVVSVNGMTFSVAAVVGSTIELGYPDDPTQRIGFNAGDEPQTGVISHKDFEDFLVVGRGRTGGSSDNEFTNELKRIVDNPEYAEVFRHDLFKNVFITASVSDPFNDSIASKLFLNWDRRRKELELQQAAFSAYYKSI